MCCDRVCLSLHLLSHITVGGITEDELEKEFAALDINAGTFSLYPANGHVHAFMY